MTFFERFTLSGPLFALILLGLVVARATPWPRRFTRRLNQFVFVVPLPLLLFRAVSRASADALTDPGVLLAFFGSCFVTFAMARALSTWLLRQTRSEAALVGVASVFSNNGLLGVPLITAFWGLEAMPTAASIMTFNAVTLWTLVTLAVEGARNDGVRWSVLRSTVTKVFWSPLVLGIVAGSLVAFSGYRIPATVGFWLDRVSATAGPLALLALGLDLAHLEIRRGVVPACCICVFKLFVHPMVAWGLCALLDLERMQSQVIVLMASLAVGVNVHLMAQHFEVGQAEVASSLVLSTLLGAMTTPLVLAWCFG